MAILYKQNRECTSFIIPNGSFSENEEAEFIDYGTGKISRESISSYLSKPIPKPPSETEGLDLLDVQSNVFGNLPEMPSGYIQRKTLESELMDRLLDRNHAIITLHGGGGMGEKQV